MKILCATDLLTHSDAAIDRAGMLADRLGAELSLLHVVPATESDRLQERELLRAGGRLKLRIKRPLWRYGRPPNVQVRTGSPAQVLIETMKEWGPDLLVLGRHRQRPAWDFLVGTMATRALSERKCPVLIVDNMCYDAYRNIVLALDGTKISLDALRAAEAWVVKDGVRATIVHAYQPVYDGALSSIGIAGDLVSRYCVDGSYDASGALRALLMDVSNDFSRYDLVVEDSSPQDIIQKVVHRVNPDLLGLGTHGRGRLGRTLLGSVANRVMASVVCDVLVVPERFAEAAGDAARSTTANAKRLRSRAEIVRSSENLYDDL